MSTELIAHAIVTLIMILVSCGVGVIIAVFVGVFTACKEAGRPALAATVATLGFLLLWAGLTAANYYKDVSL